MRNGTLSAIAVAALAMAAPAAAVTVVGAKSVEITSAANSWIQVAEFEAFTFGALNVAAAANGGSAVGTGNYVAASTPGKAIDGIRPASYPNIYHSDGSGPTEKLTISFAAPQTLASISIWGRQDCCISRDFYNVRILDAVGGQIYAGQLDARLLLGAAAASVTFDAPPPVAPGVPEPTTWAMLILGFGLVGSVARGRTARMAA